MASRRYRDRARRLNQVVLRALQRRVSTVHVRRRVVGVRRQRRTHEGAGPSRALHGVHRAAAQGTRAATRRMTLSEARQQVAFLRAKGRHLDRVLLLVEQYIPACVALGRFVRDAYWQGHERNTAYHAKNAMLTTLVVLAKLGEGAPHKQEYFRTTALALLQWTTWHDHLPGCLFVEEACEAMLARLGSSCKLRPQAATVEDVSNLFVLLEPVQTLGEVHPVRSHAPTRPLVAAVRVHLRRLM